MGSWSPKPSTNCLQSRIAPERAFAMTRSDDDIAGVYKPRNPKDSPFHSCVENRFEELEKVRDDMYAPRYGFRRPYIKDVVYRYLDCGGDLRCGFARVRCDHCGHEYLLAFSCKRRHFCPSCHQKRVVEYGEWLLTDVLKKVPRRHWVFRTPSTGSRGSSFIFRTNTSSLSDASDFTKTSRKA